MKEKIQNMVFASLKKIISTQIVISEIQIDSPRDKTHGDFSSNIALILSKKINMPPRDLAILIKNNINYTNEIEKIEIAGPGFLNFFISNASQNYVIKDIIENTEKFVSPNIGNGKKVILEYVSSNPTGPIHVGHGRSAAYGSVIANILKTTGYSVWCEYYVNDAGRQMDILAASIWLRYLLILGESFSFPTNGYKGLYVNDIAEKLIEKYKDKFRKPASEIFKDVPKDEQTISNLTTLTTGDKEAHIDGIIKNAKLLLGNDFDLIHKFGLDDILSDIKNDLEEFGLEYDCWFSEKQLFNSNAIEKSIKALDEKGYIYKKDGATWFCATQFGDEKDRVLIRDNGQTTYFASDVAYHWNKLERGFDMIIDVFGADHHGYVPRVKAAVEALGLNADALHFPIVQFAILYRDGERAQMSTRSGEFVTLRELRNEIGNDATRLFYIMRKSDAHMDFDLTLAKSQTNENPLFYIQYAHARICSVFRQLKEKNMAFDQNVGVQNLDLLTSEHEKALCSLLTIYPETVKKSSLNLEPHLVVNYLRELANAFHTYYNSSQFLVNDQNLRDARLCLVLATKHIIASGLKLVKLSVPEVM